MSFEDIPYILMAAFFVYNICYPKGCINFYSFLEAVLLKFRSDKASPTACEASSSKTECALSISYLCTFIVIIFFTVNC